MVQPPEELPVRHSGTGGPPEPDMALGAPWTGWDDASAPATAFRRLAGWTVTTDPPGATCRVERVAGPFSGGRAVARLTASSEVPIASVVLVPPEPVVLREPFDSLEFRIGARSADGAADPVAAAPARVEVRIEDARGAVLRVPLGAFAAGRWTIAQARMPAPFALTSTPPCRIVSFSILEWRAPAASELYLSGFSAYLEQGVPIVPAWRTSDWRSRWEPPFRRVVRAALASDPGDPGSGAPGPAPSPRIETVAPGRFVLYAADPSGETSFTVDSADWFRGGEIAWNGRPCGRWSGLEIEGEGFDATPRLAAVVDGRLRIETAGGLSVEFRIEGRVLCVGMDGGHGSIRAIRAGQIRPSSPLAGFRLPMLPGPRLLMWRCSDPVGTPVFALAGFDPAESAASRIGFGVETAIDRPGEVEYQPASDGRRAPVHEVFRVGLSARVDDVLPRIGPCRGLRAPDAAVALWMETPPMGTGRLGEVWDDAGAGPLVLLPPGLPGEPSFEACIDCLDPRWSRDLVRRSPGGAWIEGERPGRFALKTPFLAALAPPDATAGPATLPVATRPKSMGQPPWAFTDYDARTPGAAGFRAAWTGIMDWGRALSRRTGAPVVADASWAWIYAGAADAYAVAADGGEVPRAGEWLPLFPLLRLNPLLPGIGPPMPPATASTTGQGGDDADHRYLASMFAHGLAPRLPALDVGDVRLWRLAFLSAALHRRQTLSAVERIAYSDGRVLMTVADALSSGLWRKSLLYLRYPDGLELWVNGSDGPWEVRLGADLVHLPPAGWYAAAPGFACASVHLDGRRVDFVRAPEYSYHDGGGAESFALDLACSAQVLARSDGSERGRRLSFWFPGAAARIGLGPQFLPAGSRVVRLSATGADGAPLAPPGLTDDGGRAWLHPPAGTRRMELEWTN